MKFNLKYVLYRIHQVGQLIIIDFPYKKFKNLKIEIMKLINNKDIYILCRSGNDSQLAVLILKEWINDKNAIIKDLIGGLKSWVKVESDFPAYF